MTTEYDSESDQYDAEESLEEAIESDNRDEFVPLMTMQFRCEFDYPYGVDKVKWTMLHEACHSPELVELFLRYGARTDIKSKVTERNGIYEGMIPFTLSVRKLWDHFWFTGWYPEQSIFTTIIVLCFPCLRSHLEAVRLLYRSTKEVEKEIYGFVKEAKLVDMAISLMAVRQEVSSPTLFKGLCDSDLGGSISLRQSVLFEIASIRNLEMTSSPSVESNEHKLVTLNTMLLLLDVFEKVGDEIESYCLQCQETDGDQKVTNAQVAAKVGYLLNKAGLTYEDFPIKDVKRFQSFLFHVIYFLS
ncbi:hypothetical protein CCACVL1_10235 [Corchorus capsularis]|uniref:Uncharacterized protein n=1 Tax=Corchorus capsularis TaxID=210143 RepID=A0A1R3IS29_COCAP|nr:hypothetical protein CCACVL1_10235 [Corchorus capsularis]